MIAAPSIFAAPALLLLQRTRTVGAEHGKKRITRQNAYLSDKTGRLRNSLPIQHGFDRALG